MMNHFDSVSVFAPATSANVAVGFDILGFALDKLGDELTLVKNKEQRLIIATQSNQQIPSDTKQNTATVALQAMLDYLNLKQGFTVHIKKNIPLSSGLGGSAACSVAALVALNHMLKKPLSREQLVAFALLGEEAACGSPHGDNVIPCLYGGMTLIHSLDPIRIIELPVIPLYAVLVHPHLELDTRTSRGVLQDSISLRSMVKQNANLAAFISALYDKNYERLAEACRDVVIEPMRAHLIPGFYDIQETAFAQGALACSISGSGPTVFALAKTKLTAKNIAKSMVQGFANQGIASDPILSLISTQGAKVYD